LCWAEVRLLAECRFVFPVDILPRILERNSTALKAFSRRAGTARDLEPVDRELKILLGIQMLQRACISVCRARWDLESHGTRMDAANKKT